MPREIDQYDFFVSYARKDNAGGWITQFVEQLQQEHRKYSGGREFRVFFDKTDIRSLDDWRHRIYESVAASRLLVAFISPAYLASEWCRREWHTWIDVEISKHILSDGAAPIYIVEVPWLSNAMTEQQVAEEIARLFQRPADTLLAREAVTVGAQVSQRQLTQVRPFYDAGLVALRHQDLLKVLAGLAKNLSTRSDHVEAAARSRNTIPPYNRRFVGRLEELELLRNRLHQGRTGVISGHKGNLPEDKSAMASVQGLGGIGKTELAFTYAHAFAGLYPGGRFLVPCDGRSDLREAILRSLDAIFRDQISDEQRKDLDLHFGAIRDCLRQRLCELGRILLVLDNVSDRTLLSPEQTDQVRVLGPYLHLLATTRMGAPEGGAYDDVHWLTLGELSIEDSLRLLEKYRPFVTPDEQKAAERIARRLGGFALCVEVVGAYLGQHSEQSYVGYLETMGLTDLEQVDQTAERGDVTTRRHNNEKRLGAILAPTLAVLSAAEIAAMEFAAFLLPDYIALPWLRQLVSEKHWRQADDVMVGHVTWENHVATLVGLALLTRRMDGHPGSLLDESYRPRIFRCHRLVQEFIRGRLTTAEKTAHQQAVEALVTKRISALEVAHQRASAALVTERVANIQKIKMWQEAQWEIGPLGALGKFFCENCGQMENLDTRGHHPECSSVKPKPPKYNPLCDCGRDRWPRCEECSMIVQPKCKICFDHGYYLIDDWIMQWIFHEAYPLIQMPCSCWNGAPPRDPSKFYFHFEPEDKSDEYYEKHGMDYMSLKEKLDLVLEYHRCEDSVPKATLRELLEKDPGIGLPGGKIAGSSDFEADQFNAELTACRLLAAIAADGIVVPDASTDIESLNKLLCAGSFYQRYPRISLSREAQILIIRLPGKKEDELKRLNRWVLEAAYPLLCPKLQDSARV